MCCLSAHVAINQITKNGNYFDSGPTWPFLCLIIFVTMCSPPQVLRHFPSSCKNVLTKSRGPFSHVLQDAFNHRRLSALVMYYPLSQFRRPSSHMFQYDFIQSHRPSFPVLQYAFTGSRPPSSHVQQYAFTRYWAHILPCGFRTIKHSEYTRLPCK